MFEMRAHVAPENQLVAAGLNNTFSCRRHLIILLHESGKILPFFFLNPRKLFAVAVFCFLNALAVLLKSVFALANCLAIFHLHIYIYIFASLCFPLPITSTCTGDDCKGKQHSETHAVLLTQSSRPRRLAGALWSLLACAG